MSLLFLTISIINLQAKHPVRNAAKNPIKSGSQSIETAGSLAIFSRDKKASPKMGTMTIKKEKLATFSFLSPNKIPVAMVVPERESPGSIAIVWAIPMMNASKYEMSSLGRGFAK